MNNEIQHIINLSKDDSTQEFCVEFLGFEKATKGKDKYNCPYCGSKDNMSYDKKHNNLKCFGCDVSGDILAHIQHTQSINFIDSIKYYAKCRGISHNLDQEQETTVETAEEIAKRKKEFEESQAKRDAKQKAQEAKEVKDKAKAIEAMTAKAPQLLNYLADNLETYSVDIHKMFPNQSDIFLDWMNLYLGYDETHKSLAVINRTLDGTTYNIKHRQKFEWNNDTKAFTNTRKSGKWLSTFNSTTYAFPYEYYKQHQDETVFIVEGEKDALNLLSYDINVLTLGGVTNSWNEHKELLKDKIVYIWFDNDDAGYKNAIERYNEIKDIAKETYIILFYHIDPSLPNKYDISDFISDKRFSTKKEILHAVAYSSYKLTTSLIEDIEEYTKLDLKEYYFNQNKKDMNDIFNIWYKTIKDKNDGSMRVKGQKDIERLDDFLENFKVLKNKKDFKEYTRDAVISIFEDEKVYENLSEEKKKEKALGYTEAIDSMIKNYESIYKDYRQTGIADMFLAFERLAYNTGYTLAKYDDSLAVWTGTHYHVIDDRVENFKGWLSTSWMPLSGVDIKKILKRNVDEIFDNLHLRAMSLNKIHHYQKDRRIFNFTNGTLTVGKKGRRTFTKIHDKKHGVMNMLDFEYDEKATAPKWEKFLHRVLPDEQDRRTLMEFMGYCFFPGHDYEAFLYLEGKTGANGKSVIIDVIKLFFGEENLSSLNIQNLYGHALQGLANKIINTGSEVNTKNLIHNQMDVLKALTSTNDAIQIDPKHTKGYPLESRHQPKMIFASNSGLDPRGLDDGVLRRALPIKFVAEIKDGEKIRDLSNRFKDELSGIMNLALQGLDRLVKNGKFTKSNTLLKSIEESKDQANPIRAYAKNTLRTYGKNFIPKKLLYLHYKTYMEEKGYYSANELTFFKALADYIPFETKTQRRFPHDHHLVELFDNDRITCISGVYIIDEEISKFNFNSKAINTNSININPDTKHINIDQTMKEEN